MLLWFAWKIVLLQYRKQHLQVKGNEFFCCDLLEKSYFCSIANNDVLEVKEAEIVVICLKNRTFAVSQTTSTPPKPRFLRCDLLEKSYFCSIANNMLSTSLASRPLWFAWKIVLLQYRKQPSINKIICKFSCDLLEKSYFCSIANNAIFVERYALSLWFAWKIVLLQYRKQLFQLTLPQACSCDLLEKSYFCSIANNHN